MKRKKNNTAEIQKQLSGKKVPILTLDQKWHELFPDYIKPANIKELEDRLNNLLKLQGKLVTDLKGLKEIKPKLMQEILENMDTDESKAGKLKAKKLEQNQKLIKDISSRIAKAEDELIELPYEIKEVNEQLMIESAKFCYNRIKTNKKLIDEIAEWISKIRDELKEKLLKKQEMEESNTKVYAYLHDLLGPEILQQLDETLRD